MLAVTATEAFTFDVLTSARLRHRSAQVSTVNPVHNRDRTIRTAQWFEENLRLGSRQKPSAKGV